ncbi:SurA N-terminal domain-containing protein [Pelagibaculum spongiae]|uniref:Periplasmic chaperone PpiD n=1 Tax=Pelagibaculum spongiae TaxID=2080658 RepID=A0A2V1H363_9GAMM|nr:SurA N-terminal domain-containing protein [Pelagibaculum spongiae]PVZ71658.1 hypothetical protein DC094_01090 [Pelagibaculum spongiae]
MMMDSIRHGVKKPVAGVIIGGLILSFALWGIQGVGTSGQPGVATVNGESITDYNLQQALQNQNQRLGEAVAQYDDASLRQQALQGLIARELLSQANQKAGFDFGDQQLKQILLSEPSFQENGKFSKTLFERQLLQWGYPNEQAFLRTLGPSERDRQANNVLTASDFVLPSEIINLVQLFQQRRSFDVLTVPAASLLDAKAISQADIEAQYNATPDAYMASERGQFEYIELSVAKIAESIQVTDTDLQAYYDQNQVLFTTPEQRLAAHILFNADMDNAGQVAAAKAKAEAVFERLQAGESFADIATAESDDLASKAQGGVLDWIVADQAEETFETALFALPAKGDFSEVIQSEYGFQIVEVRDVKPGSIRPLGEVRDQVAADLKKNRAAEEYQNLYDLLVNSSYEQSDSLAAAADETGLPLQQSGWIEKTAASGVFADVRVRDAAFSDQVISENLNSEAVDLSDQHVVVVHVSEHQPSRVKPLADVSQQIRTELAEQNAATAAAGLGQKWLAELAKGDAPALDLAGTPLQWVVNDASQRFQFSVDPLITTEAFKMAAPKADQPVLTGIALNNGDYALVRLRKVLPGDASELQDQALAGLTQNIERQTANQIVERRLDLLREKAKIIISE